MFGQVPLTIIHCVRAPIGGIFRHILDLAGVQTGMGHRVGIVCDMESGGAHERALIAASAPRLALGIRHLSMRREPHPADLTAARRLAALLRRSPPDVLHGHGAKGGALARAVAGFGLLSRRRTVTVYCPHGGSLHYDPKSWSGAVYFRLERLLETLTDGLVFVSAFEEEAYRAKVGIPNRPRRLVYNGLRAEEFEPIAPDAGMADLMFVGMMRDLKGPGVLIEALARLRRERSQRPTLRFVGDGPDRPRYEAAVREAGLADQITFLDPMPTRAALSQGRVLVMPSLAESMPYVVLEAVAARIPVIATAVGGIPEIFGPRAPRLVPPGDPDALAAALVALLADEAAARADAMAFGRDLSGRFALDRMGCDIVAFYEELLRPRHQRDGVTPTSASTLARLRADTRR